MRPHRRRHAVLALVVAGLMPSFAAAAAPDDDMAIAQSLAEMLRDARTVISNEQDRINDSQLGDKHVTGKIVLDQAIASYIKGDRDRPEKDQPRVPTGAAAARHDAGY